MQSRRLPVLLCGMYYLSLAVRSLIEMTTRTKHTPSNDDLNETPHGECSWLLSDQWRYSFGLTLAAGRLMTLEAGWLKRKLGQPQKSIWSDTLSEPSRKWWSKDKMNLLLLWSVDHHFHERACNKLIWTNLVQVRWNWPPASFWWTIWYFVVCIDTVACLVCPTSAPEAVMKRASCS